jgi:NAD-dependent SIR2 family protein deacetylase
MTKTSLLATLFAAASIIVIAFSGSPASAGDPACKTTEFKTEMAKAACTKGGQKEAKAVMQKFMKEKKFKSCNACHSKLAPNYELKKDGLQQFTDAGGK